MSNKIINKISNKMNNLALFINLLLITIYLNFGYKIFINERDEDKSVELKDFKISKKFINKSEYPQFNNANKLCFRNE